MTWQDLAWEDCDFPISEDHVNHVERLLHVRFPDDFRACVKECHGGTPSPRGFRLGDERGEMGSCLAVLLSFDHENEENIVATYRLLADQLPAGVIPFGEDGGGDCICFCFEQPATPPAVVYWHHERPKDASTTYLAPTFSAFIEMLH